MHQPALYTKSNNLQRSAVSAFAQEFAEEIGKMTGQCLDVGSGPGDTVVDLILPKLNAKASLVCSDVSEKMVNFGKERYKDNGRVSFMKLDIETPCLPEDLVGHFDHVTSSYCLHWCQDMRRVFGNIFDLLRPGGTAFLSFVANHSVFDTYPVLAAIPRYRPYMKDVDRFTPVYHHDEQRCQSLEALVNAVGFEVHHCSVREVPYIFETPESWNTFLLAVNPFMERMPADLKEEYRKHLVEDVTRRNLTFDKIDGNGKEYSVLSICHTFVVYLRKPLLL